jgi:hypothetical protein
MKDVLLKEENFVSHSAFKKVKNSISSDPRAYALNPAIAKRLAIGAGALSVMKAGGSLFSPDIPDANIVYDGTGLRAVQDLGADGNYAKTIMGRHSRVR